MRTMQPKRARRSTARLTPEQLKVSLTTRAGRLELEARDLDARAEERYRAADAHRRASRVSGPLARARLLSGMADALRAQAAELLARVAAYE